VKAATYRLLISRFLSVGNCAANKLRHSLVKIMNAFGGRRIFVGHPKLALTDLPTRSSAGEKTKQSVSDSSPLTL
jgi:hypothetical protein